MVTAVTDVLPHTGAAREPRRQIFITDGEYQVFPHTCCIFVLHNYSVAQSKFLHLDRKDATVTLWGNFATGFDADMLCNWSRREPVLVLFIGTMVDLYAGNTPLSIHN